MLNVRSRQEHVPRLRRGLAAGIALLAMPIALISLVLDQWEGVTTYPVFHVVVLTVTGLLGLSAFVLSRRRTYLLLPAVLGLELLVLSAVDFSPVKPAKRALAVIHTGMSEAQVRSVFSAAFPPGGRFHQPSIGPVREGIISFVLDPTDGRYDAAIVEVTFRSGKVVKSRFLAD